ncbi:MAG: phosphoglucosamine mutase, partial [Chloroflexota bacterium]|nr:phosphoglucosamine mutase [Chloroflexota bacterium]
MGRLFGTDGIRGVANADLTPALALALARATVHRLLPGGGALLVGQDTRRSGDMFRAAIVAGATSMGADVHRAGTLPTPALAFICGAAGFEAAVMISASHNPANDNGLKVLDERGQKLDDAVEDELEAIMERSEDLRGPTNAGLGREVEARELLGRYREHRVALARSIRSPLAIVVDCANGSAGVVAPEILAATGASVTVCFNDPDGSNINLGCGATAPEALARRVAELGADAGFALDGDGDRCVAVDERGQIVDGDQLMGLIALDRLGRGALAGETLVVNVLSNGGLAAAVESAGGRIVRAPVGDKYVLDAMLASGAGVGGEKSGHVIVREHGTSGDGIVTALEVLGILARRAEPLSRLAAQVPLFPQQQRTVHVRRKEEWQADRPLADAVHEVEAELGRAGRVLVRPSGTESALRIMIEGRDPVRVDALVDRLATLAAERLN